MPPSPIPAPLPPWARALLQVLPFITAGLQEALQYIHAMNDNTQTTNSEWRHVQCVFKPITSTETADNAITTFDVVNITGGTIDNSWTQADYDSVDSDIATLCTGWLAHMGTSYQHTERRYYRRSFNPMTVQEPFTKAGPPEQIKGAASAGTATGSVLRQGSFTTTDRTTYARHWGRNYWPFPSLSGTTITGDGYITTALTDSWGQAVHDQYQNMMTKEFFPVVPVTQVSGVPTRGLLTLTELQMDNVPDVIRRRRPKFATHKFRDGL